MSDSLKSISSSLLANSLKLVREGKLQEASSTYDLIINSGMCGIEDALASKAYLLFSGFFNLRGAKILYKKAICLDPCHLSSINGLGVVYRYSYDYSRAKSIFLISLSISPDNTIALINLGTILISIGEHGGWRLYVEGMRFSRATPGLVKDIPVIKEASQLSGSHIIIYNEERAENILYMIPCIKLIKKEYSCDVTIIVQQHLLFILKNLPHGIKVHPYGVNTCFFGSGDGSVFRCGVFDLPLLAPDLFCSAQLFTRDLILGVNAPNWSFDRNKKDYTIGIHYAGENDRYCTSVDRFSFSDLQVIFDIGFTFRLYLAEGKCATHIKSSCGDNVDVIFFSQPSDIESSIIECDLFISGDDIISHVVGFLGVPCIVVLSSVSHYSWGINKSSVHHYPNIIINRKSPIKTWRNYFIELKEFISQALIYDA